MADKSDAVATREAPTPSPGTAVVPSDAVQNPGFPPYLAALVGSDLVGGNVYEVLTNGDQIFPAMLKAIDGARHRILRRRLGGVLGDEVDHAVVIARALGFRQRARMRSKGGQADAGHVHVLAEHIAECCNAARALGGDQFVLNLLHIRGWRFSTRRARCQPDKAGDHGKQPAGGARPRPRCHLRV